MTRSNSNSRVAMAFRAALLTTAAIVPSAAYAQEATNTAPDSQTGTEAGSDIVVTGSRIVRNGADAPTPVTVLGEEQLRAVAAPNIADAINQLPQLAGSSTTRTGTNNIGNGYAGSNFFNLRGFNPNRTLVLLDSRRVAPSNVSGIVDVNTLPSALVSRVDIVTGGASAVYGSDAVTGVVNLVLDTKFTGLKGSVESSVTSRGDGSQQRIELSGGTSFSDDRGHLLFSGSYLDSKGVGNAETRPWYNGSKLIPNPAYMAGNGQPQLIIANNANLATAAPGAIVTSGPLRGTTFDANGQPRAFQYGTVSSIYSIGGEPNDVGRLPLLDAPLKQANFFGRVEFEPVTNVKLFGQFTYGYAKIDSLSSAYYRLSNVTVSRENPFLPASTRQQMLALGLTSLTVGTTNEKVGRLNPINTRNLYSYQGGIEADLGGTWKASAYYQYGRTTIDNVVKNSIIVANYNRAIDVRAVNGQNVCAVNADASTANDDPACVPLNIIGTAAASPQALNYVLGTASFRTNLTEQVASGFVSGEPISLWAGPVSVVGGVEWRKEAVNGQADARSLANAFNSGNFKPTFGQYDVIEGFGEIAVPLARDITLLKALDFNGAVRRTHYSISGNATTWKVGLTYEPVGGLRFRATRSRDIRAPNLNDLFLGTQVFSNQSVNDPQFGGALQAGLQFTSAGNPNLKPEIADTVSFGAVLQPDFLSGLVISADYYKIKIKDTIAQLTGQQIVDRCFAGNTGLCSAITRDPITGRVTTIFTASFNLAREVGSGLDVEASYRKDLGEISSGLSGVLGLRGVGSYVFTHYTDDGISRDILRGENLQGANGAGGLPRWRWLVSATYDRGPLSVLLSVRAISSGKYSADYAPGVLTDNRIAGAAYYDFGATYRVPGSRATAEFFAKIDNVFDKDPANVAGAGTSPYTQYNANPSLYDTLGRIYRVGMRFKL